MLSLIREVTIKEVWRILNLRDIQKSSFISIFYGLTFNFAKALILPICKAQDLYLEISD